MRRAVRKRTLVLLVLLVAVAGLGLEGRQYLAAQRGVLLRSFTMKGCGLALLQGATLEGSPNDERHVWLSSGITLAWPEGTRVLFEGPRPTIVTAAGFEVAHLGDTVLLTGGFFADDGAFNVCQVNRSWPPFQWPY